MNGTLMTYTKEFVAICSYLERSYPAQSTNASLFIEQKQLVELLDKNKYEESQTKLAIWRNLHWIDCEPGRFNRKTKVNGRQCRMVHLRRSVYEQLRAFSDGNRGGNHSKNTSGLVPTI